MDNKTRDLNAAECMVWMFKNNPKKIDIYMSGDYPRYLISFVPASQLKFPEGWHYSEENKSINKDISSIDIVRILFKE